MSPDRAMERLHQKQTLLLLPPPPRTPRKTDRGKAVQLTALAAAVMAEGAGGSPQETNKIAKGIFSLPAPPTVGGGGFSGAVGGGDAEMRRAAVRLTALYKHAAPDYRASWLAKKVRGVPKLLKKQKEQYEAWAASQKKDASGWAAPLFTELEKKYKREWNQDAHRYALSSPANIVSTKVGAGISDEEQRAVRTQRFAGRRHGGRRQRRSKTRKKKQTKTRKKRKKTRKRRCVKRRRHTRRKR